MAAEDDDFGVPAENVVTAMDVIVHHELDGRIHKLTHPLRPSYRAPDAPAAARLRPERNKFEFEYAIPQTAMNFDDRAASDPRMRKLKHKSAEVPMKTTHFVGIVRSGALHLHPIQSLQMVRPDMTYLDTAGTGEGTPATPLAATAVRTAISAQFKRTDDRAVAARNRSYGYFRSQEEADPWIPLVAHGPDAPRAGRVRDLLTSHPDDLFESDEAYEAHVEGVGKALEPAIGSEAAGRYLRTVSGGNQQSINAASLAAQNLSVSTMTGRPVKTRVPGRTLNNVHVAITDLAQRPLAIQIEETLRRAAALPFARLIEFGTNAPTPAALLDMTRRHARLVRGSWVLRSEVLYKPHWTVRMAIMTHLKSAEELMSRPGGAGATQANQMTAMAKQIAAAYHLKPSVLQKAVAYRDAILAAFRSSATIVGSEITAATGMTRRMFLSIVKPLAKQDAAVSDTWHWQFEADEEFAAALPTEVSAQEAWWEKRTAELAAFFTTRSAALASATAAAAAAAGAAAAAAAPALSASGVPLPPSTAPGIREDAAAALAASIAADTIAPFPSVDALQKDAPNDRELHTLYGALARQYAGAAVGAPGPAGAAAAAAAAAGKPAGAAAGAAAAAAAAGDAGGISAPLPAVRVSPEANEIRHKMPVVQQRALITWVGNQLREHCLVRRDALLKKFKVDQGSGPLKELAAIYAAAEALAAATAGGGAATVAAKIDRLLLGAMELALAERAVEVPVRGAAATGIVFYATKDAGGHQERLRSGAIRYLCANAPAGTAGVKKKQVADALREAFGEEPPDAVLTRFLKEVAVSQGSSWVLKTGEIAGAAAAAAGGDGTSA